MSKRLLGITVQSCGDFGALAPLTSCASRLALAASSTAAHRSKASATTVISSESSKRLRRAEQRFALVDAVAFARSRAITWVMRAVLGGVVAIASLGGCLAVVDAGFGDAHPRTVEDPCDGHAGAHVWSRSFGGYSVERPMAMTLDTNGDVILTGISNGEMQIEGDAVAPGLFVIKLHADGELVWARSFGELGVGAPESIAIDRTTGGIVFTAEIRHPVDFGVGLMTPPFDKDALVELDASGNAISSAWIGGDTSNTKFSVAATDANGRVLVGGVFRGKFAWPGGPTLDAGPTVHLYLSTLDQGLSHEWSRDAGRVDVVNRVAFDKTGALLVVGAFLGPTDLGGGTIGDGPYTNFVAKFGAGPGHPHQWSHAFGTTTEWTYGRGLAVRSDDSVVIDIPFSGLLGVPSIPPAVGALDIGVIALEPSDGAVRWARAFGGVELDTPWDIAAGPDDSVVVSGAFSDSIDPGPCSPLVSAGQFDALLVKLAPDGTSVWAHAFGDGGDEPIDKGWPSDIFYNVAVDSAGSVITSGTFDGSVDFGGGVLAAPSPGDLIVARYSP
jgi:hypothetical protein